MKFDEVIEELKQGEITDLNLANNELGDVNFFELVRVLPLNKNLTALNLSSTQLNNQKLTVVTQALLTNYLLTSLNLSFNEINTTGIATLDQLLNQIPNLFSLNLRRNQLNDQGVQILLKLISNHPTLANLNLAQNQIGPQGLHSELLRENYTLTSVNLSGNQLGNQGAKTLATALEHNYILTQLDLANNQIESLGIQALAEVLQTNHTLTSLSLCANSIGPSGIQAIAQLLANNSSLLSLNLADGNLNPLEIQTLAKELANNETLTTLDLYHNNTGNLGAQALAESLTNNHTLTKLNLRFNQIATIGIQALIQMLNVNSTLTVLDLGNNQITEQNINELTKTLNLNNTLIILYLSTNNLSINIKNNYKMAWEQHKKQQQKDYKALQEAIREGNAEQLNAWFERYHSFPLATLSSLVQHKHLPLVYQWETYWPRAALQFQDEKNNTPLHYAVFNFELVEWLLQKGAALYLTNDDQQTPLALLKASEGFTGKYFHNLGNHYFKSETVKQDFHKAVYWYGEAAKLGYSPAIWLLYLMTLLNVNLKIPFHLKQSIHSLEELPPLSPEQFVQLSTLVITPEGKPIPLLGRQDYTLYHLIALIGSKEWLEIVPSLLSEKDFNFNPKLISQKNLQGLRPSELTMDIIKNIAEERKVSYISPEAQNDIVLKRYFLCEKLLRHREEKSQLDLLLMTQQSQAQERLDYDARTQALKANIETLYWNPKDIKEKFIQGYATIIQKISEAKQFFVYFDNFLKKNNINIWPEGFYPYAIQMPVEIIDSANKNLPFHLKIQASLKGSAVYLNEYCTKVTEWLRVYIANNQKSPLTFENHERVKKAFTQLIDAYKLYEILWKSAATEKEKQWLLSSPALLLQAGCKPIFIDPLIKENYKRSPATTLTYFLNAGKKIEGMADAGNSPVFSINGVHYKRTPRAPGVEFMVSSLGKVLAGEGATPTELLKVISAKAEVYTYQASHTVQGKDLQSILEHHPEYIKKIRPGNFAALVVLGMLTDPQDGKPDNYMVEFSQNEAGEVIQIDILGIDNDVAFSDVVVSQHESGENKGKYIMNIKNVFYFFPQMMEPIDGNFCKELLKQQPELTLIEWLRLLLIKNKEYEILLEEGIFTQEEYIGDGFTSKRGLQLPIKVVPGTMARVYRKLKQLHITLTENPNITLWSLLTIIEPEVATHYAKLKQTYPHPTLGCDLKQCIKTLYEENVSNGRELMQLRADLDKGYTHSMTKLILKTAEAFGFEDNRIIPLKQSAINLLKCLKYEDFQGESARILYKTLEDLISKEWVEPLLTLCMINGCTDFVYWLWKEKMMEIEIIQAHCEETKKCSLLHFFAENKHLPGLKTLLKQGIYKINITNRQGCTPLHLAASTGDEAMVSYLLCKGADIRAKTIRNKTPLMMAESRCKQMNEKTVDSGDKKYNGVIVALKKAATSSSRTTRKEQDRRFSFLQSHRFPSTDIKQENNSKVKP